MIAWLRRPGARLEKVAVAIALVPVAIAIGRHTGRGWIPIGDNALVEMRSRDVFSFRHFPFLGTWSSASLSAGTDLNHPGPLLFDLLAVPVRLFGGATGIALGVGLINAAAIAGSAAVAYRVRGRVGALAATLIATALSWTMGSSMLTDPWNPHVLMLPCLFMLIAAWAVAAGDVVILPWLIGVASLCLQNHLGYAYLVPGLIIGGLVGAAVVHRRRWRIDPECRAGDLRRMRRIGVVTLAAGIVLWWQPIVEQLFGQGRGNLARIATSSGGDQPTIGAATGLRILGSVVAVPPWWGRSSIVDAVPHVPYNADGTTITPTGLTSLPLSLVSLAFVVGLLVLALWWSWRRADRPMACACALAVGALAVAAASLAIMPIGPIGLTPHQMRWLWPIGGFVVFCLALVIIELVGDRRALSPVLVVLVAAVAALNVPAHVQLVGPDTFQDSIPVARALADQVRRYHTPNAVVFDTSNLRYLEPYSAVVFAAMADADVDLRVRDEGLVRQLGNNRRADGSEPLTAFILEGRAALDPPEGSTVIAFTSPLSDAELSELLSGEAAMTAAFGTAGVIFTAGGEQAISAGQFAMTRDEIIQASLDPERFVASGLVAELIAAGALDVDGMDADTLVRVSELRRRVGTTTVAVFVQPTSAT
jgi:hypothetical protein